jgi:hypothetical protein
MKPTELQAETEAVAQKFRYYFVIGDKGSQQILLINLALLCKRQQCGPSHRTYMRIRRDVGVIEIKRMRGHTIHQRRILHILRSANNRYRGIVQFRIRFNRAGKRLPTTGNRDT